jgi:hypothetical protein
MATEMLSYSQLGERLNCSPEAARALVRRLRLPRQKANDGKVLVSVDLNEINHKPIPARSSGDNHPVTASLKAGVQRNDDNAHDDERGERDETFDGFALRRRLARRRPRTHVCRRSPAACA